MRDDTEGTNGGASDTADTGATGADQGAAGGAASQAGADQEDDSRALLLRIVRGVERMASALERQAGVDPQHLG